jgi:hypothetical protein
MKKKELITAFGQLGYSNRVLSIVSPKKYPELCSQALAVSEMGTAEIAEMGPGK